MKKLLFTLALAIACATGFAKTVDDVFNQFKGKPNVTFVDAPKSMIESQLDKMGNDKMKAVAQKIESAKVLVLDDCADDVKAEFKEVASKLNTNDYTPIVQTNNDGNNVKILSKQNGDITTEFLVIVCHGSDNVMVQVKGSFTADDIAQLTKSMDHFK